MTQKPFLHRRIASCSRHTTTCIRTPDVGLDAFSSEVGTGSREENALILKRERIRAQNRNPLLLNSLSAGGDWGCHRRNEYGSVSCVPPVACRAGVVFGGDRRISHPSFGKISPWRRAPRSRASRRLSRQTALRSSLLSARCARVAPGCRRGANASARLCRYPCQFPVERCSRWHGHVGWFI